MISQPDNKINGEFRFMDVDATRNKVNVSLESTETGIIRHKSDSLGDVLSTVLKKLNESSISS
jgi:hypothetical protein